MDVETWRLVVTTLLSACGALGSLAYWDIRKRVERTEHKLSTVLVVLLTYLGTQQPSPRDLIEAVTKALQEC